MTAVGPVPDFWESRTARLPVLTERAADRQADPETCPERSRRMVAFPGLSARTGKLMTWSWKLTDEQRGGLTTRQPACRQTGPSATS